MHVIVSIRKIDDTVQQLSIFTKIPNNVKNNCFLKERQKFDDNLVLNSLTFLSQSLETVEKIINMNSAPLIHGDIHIRDSVHNTAYIHMICHI